MMAETPENYFIESLALNRMRSTLEFCERNKMSWGCHWLYVCARNKGKKIKSIWIQGNENLVESAFSKLDQAVGDATSFEVEVLYDPIKRSINLSNRRQWNSYRGKYAIELCVNRVVNRWSSLEILARNIGFSKLIDNYLKIHNLVDYAGASVEVTLYRTTQWFCDNSNGGEVGYLPKEIFRGSNLVDIDDVNRGSAMQCALGMTRWLAAQVSESGKANYKYWPSSGRYSNSNNSIRQWMATVCLGRAAKAFGNEDLFKTYERNLIYNLAETYRENGEQGYILMDGSAKLGAAALAALAILESPYRKKYIRQEYKLNDLISELSHSNGSFDTFYIPRDRKDCQNFYPGEALLFLSYRFYISRSKEQLDRIMQGFRYYREWHYKYRNPAFVPWHTQAYFLVWKITKSEELKDFIFEMNDWLLSMQQWESAEFEDMKGRFYDPDRSHFGPPHASSTGVYLEGLIDAFSLAREVGDEVRLENYRIAIIRGIRSLMQLQYKDAVDCFYIRHVDRVLGGLRTTVYDNTIRIDNVQHGLMALLKILSRFSDSDFTMVKKKPLSGSQKKREIQYKHFKKMEFPIDVEAIRKEIHGNEHLWLDNTSRQRNIRVQRETHTIFLRTAKKPFPPGVIGNDIHLSGETKNSELFPLLMKALQEFSSHVDGELSRVTVVRLQPESRVYPHIDEGEYYKYRDRYHIVVDSPTGSEMTAGNEKIVWREGEFWWFDNKAMHEAHNRGSSYRVHVIFDVLPKKNFSIVSGMSIKQGMYSSSFKVSKLIGTSDRLSCFPACEVDMPPPFMDYSQIEKFRGSSFFQGSYSLPKVVVERFDDVSIIGNKFVLIDNEMNILESSLPTYHHKPDHFFLNKKWNYYSEVCNNEVVLVDEVCAIISNSNWKNYWHWHAQCITSINILKQTGLFGKVRLLTPPLNEWRLKSLYALGVDDSMIIKVRANIVRIRSVFRPSCIDKINQPFVHPSTLDTYTTIRNYFTDGRVSRMDTRRIYVSRSDAKSARDMVNEEVLEAALRNLGFEIVVPGRLSYEKQVEIFSQAAVVVGAHGAGLTNIVFCKPRTLVVELFPEYYFFKNKLAYRNHAHVGNLEYACYVSDKYVSELHKREAERHFSEGRQSNFPWEVDVEKFMLFLSEAIKERCAT